MFGKSVTIFKLFGFSVKVDLSWLILALLITWSLAGFFPSWVPNLPQEVYWVMGVAGAIGLFASIVFHELVHSLVARRYGLPIKGITLFIFGGVSELNDEPPSAKAEFWIAIMGPISSVLAAGVFYAIAYAGASLYWPMALSATFNWLGMINLILAGFNLIPGFPLDGGRVLRSALWHWKGNLRWATRVAANVGGGFGMLLIVLGVITILQGFYVSGLWQFLIGMFLRTAAKQSYQQVVLREALHGEPIHRFMNTTPLTVGPDLSVRQLVEEVMYRHHFQMYPVVDQRGNLIGYVATQHVKAAPMEQWDNLSVGDIAEPVSPDNTAGPTEDAMSVLERMTRTGVTRLMVVDGIRLVGIVTLKDLMALLSIKMELTEGQRAPGLRMAEPHRQWRSPVTHDQTSQGERGP